MQSLGTPGLNVCGYLDDRWQTRDSWTTNKITVIDDLCNHTQAEQAKLLFNQILQRCLESGIWSHIYYFLCSEWYKVHLIVNDERFTQFRYSTVCGPSGRRMFEFMSVSCQQIVCVSWGPFLSSSNCWSNTWWAHSLPISRWTLDADKTLCEICLSYVQFAFITAVSIDLCPDLFC